MSGPHILTAPANPSQAQIQDMRRRMNQQPAIHKAQVTADLGLVQPPIGAMMDYGAYQDTPDGKWLLCDGRTLDLLEYAELYAVIGATWNLGSEPAGTFRIPDRRGRTSVGAGQGTGLTDRTPGSRFGNETETLSVSQIPSHSHGGATGSDSHTHTGTTDSYSHYHAYTRDNTGQEIVQSGSGAGVQGHEDSDYTANTATNIHSHSLDINSNSHSHPISSQGGGGSHNNMPPSLAVPIIIRARL